MSFTRLWRIAHAIRVLSWRLTRPRTRGVRAILVRADRRILLVRHSYLAGWYLPGGANRARETDIAAVRREITEELGLTLTGRLRILGSYQNRAEYKRDTITVFVAKCPGAPQGFSPEIADRRFFDPRRLPKGTSPGTRRRIAEWLGARPINNRW